VWIKNFDERKGGFHPAIREAGLRRAWGCRRLHAEEAYADMMAYLTPPPAADRLFCRQ
jgi:hypothetical protein